MPARLAIVALVCMVLVGLPVARAVAEDAGASSAQVDETVVDPEATVPGVTPTPQSTATPLPLETATPEPGATPTPTPTPTGRDLYITPGYGNALQQPNSEKRRERDRACDTDTRPPTSHMLGAPGVVLGNPDGSWLPILLAVAVGATVVAVAAFSMRRRRPRAGGPGMLEGVATFVAICGGLAALAAQFIPSAAVKEHPPKVAEIEVRDVKPRITRGEYLSKIPLTDRQKHRISKRYARVDLDEVGNVVWLEIGLRGFKDQRLRLEFGSYDLDARGALLPDSSRSVQLGRPERDVQTLFFPAWVGYPRSERFKVEFRLVDDHGVQQLAATEPMATSSFRYACEERT